MALSLSRAHFAERKPVLKEVPCPECGGSVFVRELPLREAEGRLNPILEEKGDVTAKLIVLLACDENGDPIFEPGDEDLVNSLPSGVGLRIAKAALDVNGLSAMQVEDEAKNS